LRSVLTLTSIHAAQGNYERARQSISTIYARFTEGFDTQDLKAAKDLLSEFPRADEHVHALDCDMPRSSIGSGL